MAQEEGFEPPTNRLTADCSTTELLLNLPISGNLVLSETKSPGKGFPATISTSSVRVKKTSLHSL